MPGTTVLIGLNAPRYSAGASGFMSYVSMCGGPPGSQRKMTDVSVAVLSLSLAMSRHGVIPPAPIAPSESAPMRMNSRRETGPGQITVGFISQIQAAGGARRESKAGCLKDSGSCEMSQFAG